MSPPEPRCSFEPDGDDEAGAGATLRDPQRGEFGVIEVGAG